MKTRVKRKKLPLILKFAMSLYYVHNNQIRVYVYFIAIHPYILTRTVEKPTGNSAKLSGMKALTTKQEARLQKKKKKMVALAEIIKLNDTDRNNKKVRSSSESSGCSSSSKESTNVKNRTHASRLCVKEPKTKRSKSESVGDIRNSDDEIPKKRIKILANDIDERPLAKAHEKSPQPATIAIQIEQKNKELTGDQYVQLKRELNERKRKLRNVPRLRLKEQGELASLSLDVDSRTPIFLTDIQHLLMVALLGNRSPCTPWRWCHLEKGSRLSHTLVLVVEGLSLFHFLSYESQFTEANRIFEDKLEVIMPTHRDGMIIEEIAKVPLTNSEKDELIKKYGSLEAAIESNKDPTLLVRTVFPMEVQPEEPPQPLQEGDTFSRTKLLLSALQMVEEGYPLPLRGKLANRYSMYKFTKDEYKAVTSTSPMFGLDCEMCKTAKGLSELTRISVVNEDLKAIYETLVRPPDKIIDYLTRYSGITAEMMKGVTKTLINVQEDIRQLLPADAILVGQSLNADLHAMRMMHPYVIDTSVIFNITGERKRKSKLSTLSRDFLGELIQIDVNGHDPFEDSLASMKLTKLKLSKGLDFGDAVLGGRKKANEVYNETQQMKAQAAIGADTKEVISHNLFAHIAKGEKRTAVIASDEVDVDFQKLFDNRANVYVADDPVNNENNREELETGMRSHLTIDCYRTKDNKATIRKTREISSNYALTITNMNVAPQRLEVSRVEKTIANVDKWIGRLWETVATNGMFIVLLGGAPGASSGVAMVKIKKSAAEAATDTPIAV